MSGDADGLVTLRRRGEAAASRREFLQFLGVTAAMAAFEGCDRRPPERILPYSVAPPDVRPGVPRWYATSLIRDGYAIGVLGESHEGRPTKLEGNPDHPASLGGLGLREQAQVLSLYDPDRASLVREGRVPSSWPALLGRLRAPRADQGAGLRIVAPPTSSPTFGRHLDRVRARHPRCRVTYATRAPSQAERGAQLACGRPLRPVYDLAAADVVLLLDADPLGDDPFQLRYARHWAARRRLPAPGAAASRYYAVECAPTVSGRSADHRRALRPSEVLSLARAVAARLPGLDRLGPADDDPFARAAARDLAAAPPGRTAVIAGARQPAAVHALAMLMNERLGNLGRAVRLAPQVLLAGDQDLAALAAELHAGQVDTVVILDGNPVYGAPPELGLDRAFARAREVFYLGAYEDETAACARWFGPALHALERWGDARAWDGTLSPVQPLLRPLTGGRDALAWLAALAGEGDVDVEALLRETHAGLDFAALLRLGAGPAPDPVTPGPLRADAIAAALPPPGHADPGLEVTFAGSATVGEGRDANVAWLLEQPDPITKLTWENAVLLGPRTAAEHGVASEDVVAVTLGGRSIEGPALVVPDHAEHALTLPLGWGRAGAESLARGRGFDASRLRTVAAPWSAAHARLARTGRRVALAITQRAFSQGERPIALFATAEAYARDPGFTRDQKGPQATLMPDVARAAPQWAMSIDLSICTGCSACMLACQAENNVPVVGKAQVLARREMHWLRVDLYLDGPRAVHQPMLCQHCEAAPCEYVCPVNATVHSPDGLNEMVYNRCVGTRYCSNNCPYKVRRFNWFNWHKQAPNGPAFAPQRNPEVTVRDRGVMEKCTYCVQRIRRAEIGAQLEDRPLRPGEVVTACQQACPTGAIQFGALHQHDSPMARWRREPRAYAALHDVGARPRTMYLAHLANPDPALRDG